MKATAEVLLDPARALVALRGAGLLLDSVEITHRRSLEAGGVAAYRLRGTGIAGKPAETLGYACWSPPDRNAALLQQWRNGLAEPGPFGDGVRAIPGLPAVLFLMPNDRSLRLLPTIMDLARLQHELAPLPDLEPAGWRIRERESRVEVLRYTPERHVVARVLLAISNEASGDSRTLDTIVRHFDDERGTRLFADTTAWRDGGADAVLPRPLGALANGRLYLEAAVAGETLRDAVRAGRVTPEAVAGALTALHGASATFARTRAADARLADAHELLRSLREAGVLDAAGVAAVAGPLTAALPQARALHPVHGDLHTRHVLMGPTGLVFVDLQRRAAGDPFDDCGSLLAHLVWESRALLPEGAATGPFAARLATLAHASSPERPASDLAFFTACTLVELAQRPVRRRAPQASAEAVLALQLAREMLA